MDVDETPGDSPPPKYDDIIGLPAFPWYSGTLPPPYALLESQQFPPPTTPHFLPQASQSTSTCSLQTARSISAQLPQKPSQQQQQQDQVLINVYMFTVNEHAQPFNYRRILIGFIVKPCYRFSSSFIAVFLLMYV